MNASIVLFVLLAIAIVIVELARARRLPFDFLFFFNVSFLVYYALAPLHLIVGGQEYATLPNIFQQYESGSSADSLHVRMAGLASVAYCATLVGYWLGRRPMRIAMTCATVTSGVGVATLCLVVGIGSLVAYMAQFSSPVQAITNAALMKTGDAPDAGQLAFLRNVIPLAGVAVPLILAVYLQQNSKLRPRHMLILGLLVGTALFALLTQGSRRTVLIFAVELFVLVANVRRRIYAGWLLVVVAVGFLMITLGDILGLGLALGVDFASKEVTSALGQNLEAFYASVWRDFTYTFQAMIGVVEGFNGIPRLLIDVPIVLVDLLPERLLPLSLPEPLSAQSTLLLTGIPVPLTAEIPPGYIGFLWYSGYFPGVVLGSVLYGLLGRMLEQFILPDDRQSAIMILVYSWAGFCWGYFLREGIPSMIVIERFHWILAATLLLAISGISFRQRYEASRETPEEGPVYRR